MRRSPIATGQSDAPIAATDVGKMHRITTLISQFYRKEMSTAANILRSLIDIVIGSCTQTGRKSTHYTTRIFTCSTHHQGVLDKRHKPALFISIIVGRTFHNYTVICRICRNRKFLIRMIPPVVHIGNKVNSSILIEESVNVMHGFMRQRCSKMESIFISLPTVYRFTFPNIGNINLTIVFKTRNSCARPDIILFPKNITSRLECRTTKNFDIAQEVSAIGHFINIISPILYNGFILFSGILMTWITNNSICFQANRKVYCFF